MVYHGVRDTVAGGLYRAGLVLLDREDLVRRAAPLAGMILGARLGRALLGRALLGGLVAGLRFRVGVRVGVGGIVRRGGGGVLGIGHRPRVEPLACRDRTPRIDGHTLVV